MRTNLFGIVENSNNRAHPFLKWAGGKRRILPYLRSFLPTDAKNRIYREPFLGAGSLFFDLEPPKAFLSDANQHLIMVYKSVRDFPDLVHRYLLDHAKNHSEGYYYHTRDIYNDAEHSAAQAARFIYLNKTCYNGIFRVNQKGRFNVPYGQYETMPIPSLDNLRRASAALQGKEISASTFEQALESVSKGEFIYLDPPYPPLNGTSCFTHYTSDKFSEKEQEKLSEVARTLDTAGCLFMLSNADVPKIRRLYTGFNLHSLPVTRSITCKKVRQKVRELIITNYEV